MKPTKYKILSMIKHPFQLLVPLSATYIPVQFVLAIDDCFTLKRVVPVLRTYVIGTAGVVRVRKSWLPKTHVIQNDSMFSRLLYISGKVCSFAKSCINNNTAPEVPLTKKTKMKKKLHGNCELMQM